MDELGHGKYTPMDQNLLPPLYLIYAENPSDSGKVVISSPLSSPSLILSSKKFKASSLSRGPIEFYFICPTRQTNHFRIMWFASVHACVTLGLYVEYNILVSDDEIIQQVHSTVRQRWLNGDKFIISSMEEVANIALEGRTALLEKDYSKLASLMNRNFDLRRYNNTNKSIRIECFHLWTITTLLIQVRMSAQTNVRWRGARGHEHRDGRNRETDRCRIEVYR